MTSNRVKEYLDQNGVKYVSIEHSPAFTAAEVASSAHVAGRGFAKTVVVRMEGRPAMIVLPATRRLVLHDLREMLETYQVSIATESDLRTLFPDCEVGAQPPFGNLYDMDVYIVASLTEQKEIAFNAGTHTEVLAISYNDYERLVMPRVIDLVTT